MSQQKPKKPFLKKGVRQFLSNATVRSLTQKKNIVDFTQGDSESFSGPFTGSNVKSEQKEEIVINVKKKAISRQKPSQPPKQARQPLKKSNNAFENKYVDSQQKNATVNSKNSEKVVTRNQNSNHTSNSGSKSIQKKPTLLADYLNNNSVKPSILNKNVNTKQNLVQRYPSNEVHSDHRALKMQDLEDESDDEEQLIDQNNNEFLTNNVKKYSPISYEKVGKQTNESRDSEEVIIPKKKPNLLQQNKNDTIRQNYSKGKQDDEQQKQINFQSDSEDESTKIKFKTQFNQKKHANRFRQEFQEIQHQQLQENSEEINRKATVKLTAKPQSKVTQMFNKNSNKMTQPTTGEGVNKVETLPQKMTIDSVPKQLIEQIVQKYFKDAKVKYQKKQQNLFEQVKIVQKKQQSLNEQQKTLQKKLKEFEKQMQEKQKQFQNKLKSEQNKITREKMYLKDQQTTGKVDWKTKNQVQQLKQQLQEQKNDKKRIQVKLKAQLDRLKVRYNEELQANKHLQNRIKQYELSELKQKESKVKEQKIQKMQNIQKKKSFWDEAPKNSFLERFYGKDFSLNEFGLDDYFFENNQFYQFYKAKGETDILQSEESEGSKIKRTYQNGKIEIESIKKFIKEVFPWGFTIVHYQNGDVKQVIQIQNKTDKNNPKKLEIYYAKTTQIIEYLISDGKRIHYFLKEDQLQLNDQLLELKQVYNGNQLQRISNGCSVVLQRNNKGKFVEIY